MDSKDVVRACVDAFNAGERLEIVGMVAEGDTVAVRFRETGRFVGPFRGLPGQAPTDRAYEIVAMESFELADGKIVRRWGARDSASITRQVLG